MSTYKIKEGQTAIDVVSQLYASQDYIGEIMLSNPDFDINEMQNGITLEYTAISNANLNEINNNGYTFINRDNIVYKLNSTTQFVREVYDLNDYFPLYFDKAYYEIVETGERIYLNASNRILRVVNDQITLKLYVEEYI